MLKTFADKLRGIAEKVSSVEEFKFQCASFGIPIPDDEYDFAKWFYGIAVSTAHTSTRTARHHGTVLKNYEWEGRFYDYAYENIDDILTPKRYADFLTTYLHVLFQDYKAGVNDRRYEKAKAEYPNARDRLRYIWKYRNRLKLSRFNIQMLLIYFKKHGLPKIQT